MPDPDNLPQLNSQPMTCGGRFQTWHRYVDGFEPRLFLRFGLIDDRRGRACLADFHRRVVEASVENGFGVVNEGLHHRASRDWGELIGFSRQALEEINIRGIEFYRDFARDYHCPETPMIVGGVVGKPGDAYSVGRTPNPEQAQDHHSGQIETVGKAGADVVTAVTLSSVEEAIGIAHAAKAGDMPTVIPFSWQGAEG